MFSRATQMADMLLLRPPPRWLLERGPPDAVKKALINFKKKEEKPVMRAIILAGEHGMALPEEE